MPREKTTVNQFVQRQHPLAGIRRLAVAMEEEDRAEVARYVAMVLQKLANMNELFMGERVRDYTHGHARNSRSRSPFCG